MKYNDVAITLFFKTQLSNAEQKKLALSISIISNLSFAQIKRQRQELKFQSLSELAVICLS